MTTTNDLCCQFYAAFKGERKHIMQLLNHVCITKGMGTYNNVIDAVSSLNNVETRMYDFVSKDELEKVRPVYPCDEPGEEFDFFDSDTNFTLCNMELVKYAADEEEGDEEPYYSLFFYGETPACIPLAWLNRVHELFNVSSYYCGVSEPCYEIGEAILPSIYDCRILFDHVQMFNPTLTRSDVKQIVYNIFKNQLKHNYYGI